MKPLNTGQLIANRWTKFTGKSGQNILALTHAREHILQLTAQRPNWQAFVYEGCDHAFARPASPRRNEAGAALAEERTLNFLGAYLG